MKLTRVTISGADDGVEHQALYDLSAEFPFVEWGILHSSSRLGTPRYPSHQWVDTFVEDCGNADLAIHLCGAAAREVLGGAELEFEWLFPVRIQLNGFSNYVLPELLVARRYTKTEFILQCSSLEAVAYAERFRATYPNVSALWDQSGGAGKPLSSWPLPYGALAIGYAGGITEHDVGELLTKLTANRETHDFWIDLESGARTDDKLDVGKVRRILEAAKAFVGA